MKEVENHKLLGPMAGQAGDYYISTGEVTAFKFSHIIAGPDGATVDDVKIRGISVKTARNYGALPAGYPMCAGGDDYFDLINLSAGNAQGLLYDEEEQQLVTFDSITTGGNGAPNASLTMALQFDNEGPSGSIAVDYRIKDAEGSVVTEGRQTLYFLKGSNLEQAITGLIYPVAGEGYTIEAKPVYAASYIASEAFDSVEE
jgi:hypothetical protein